MNWRVASKWDMGEWLLSKGFCLSKGQVSLTKNVQNKIPIKISLDL
jgi:hypothetical protein